MVVNKEIRETMKEKGVRQWQVADQMGKSEEWLSRKLRKELTPEKKEEVMQAIEAVVKQNA